MINKNVYLRAFTSNKELGITSKSNIKVYQIHLIK